jgi:hypothetical protein
MWNHPRINASRNKNKRSTTSSGFLGRGCSEQIRTKLIVNFDHREFESGTGIQVNNSALTLIPSRHRAHATLQRIWFDIIGEILPHSRHFASSMSALRATINDYNIIIVGRSKTPGTGGESIILAGLPEAIATGP